MPGIWSMPHDERMALYEKWAALHLENTAAEFRDAQARHCTATQSLQVLPVPALAQHPA